MISSIRNAALTLAAASMVTSPVAANVGDSMDRFMDDMGAAANVTGPTAFEGQSAGYYSLGNVWTRFPQKTTNIANLQLPRARAGCGGIDIFAGSFSFINASEMVALLKAVANNAVGFAFSLAIDTVCPECNKIMQEFSQKAQLMNNLSINSCEMAQGLVGGLWPKGDLADKAICEAIGNSEGIFTDYAAAKHGCGTRGQRASTNEGAGTDYADINPGVARNYTWHVLKKSAFFNPGGTFDRELAEYAMTLIGTVIYVPPKDDEAGKFVPFAGDASSTLVSALLDGTQGQTVRVFRCDETDLCLNPTFEQMSLSNAKAIRPRVALLIGNMVDAIRTDTAIGNAEKELLQVASVPLYKILTVEAAYGRGMPTDDRDTLAEIASIDLLYAILDRIVSEAGRSMASFIAADEAKLAIWRGQVAEVRSGLVQRQATGQAKVSAIMQIIEKTAMIENALAASMSPSMSAALDWSRGLQSRSIIP
ncbi:conjugal transfer protein TraH [Erythrobacter sp. SCSIO 43205]|uniref:conjugal transfer protein TraH n=1 Tax=Erythrobacter sp. SCSIO 43205 TaxID=2779361 RepID=UPI001CAA18DC|nr:conjugal transfer protein TraH [Erythrobacter sp. SCSIO 43205]UAB79237.1 conjugal transfer protein TraH [Erythrobacter sp. SCSIO 43205]